MFQAKTNFVFGSLFTLIMILTTACSPTKFEAMKDSNAGAPATAGDLPSAPALTPTPEPQPTPVPPTPTPEPTPVPPTPAPQPTPDRRVSETFTQDLNANKVDILIVDDNSESMESKQRKMGEKFRSFISGIKDLDYQIGITTTDLSGPLPKGSGFATDGRLVTYTRSKINILTPSTPDADKLFLNSIKRDETIDCGKRKTFPFCPSSNEQPLKAMIMAIDERFKSNFGFFRDGADLTVVVLTDEDEMSDGTSSAMTKPYMVMDAFKAAFADRKRLMVHGVIIQPGNKKCLANQRAASNIGYYGAQVSALATATGGRTYSICDADYGKNLTSISQDVRKLVATFELLHEPLDASKVEVTLTPAVKLGWHIEGKLLIFDSPPAPSTRIDVRYTAK